MLNITNIPAPRVPFIDERTGLMAREWYRFFLNLFVLTGSGNNPITLEELQLGPPNQPDFTELLIQINKDIAPQYEDQSGDFLATLDTAQLMSMMARFESAEAAIQGAYLQPVVQTGTIANYNLDSSPTAGGIAYGTGPALAVSAAGTLGQVLTSAGAGTPTWAAAATGTVTSVSVVSANGLAGTVATATTTPAITLSTTITGLLKGNGTAISAATSGTDYAPATSGTSILYGNGAGGFSNVTIGTGVAFAGGTLSATGSGGTVTSVAALTLGTTGTDLSSTVANGTTTPVITLQVPTASASNRGALSAADWTTFNNKGSGTVTSVTGTAPVVSSGGTTPAISMAAATTSVNGYLTSTDWNTFNGKGSGTVTSVSGTGTVNGITLTGTVTTTGSLTLGGALSGVSLTTQVSGTLPVGNGGTGLTALTSNYIPYGNGASAFNSSTNLTFDGTTLTAATGANFATTSGNVGIGISSPSLTLDVVGAQINPDSNVYGSVKVRSTTAYNSTPRAGIIFSVKYNSGGTYGVGSSIQGYKENSSDGDFGQGILFTTQANGAAPAERMRIASNGIVTMSAYGAGAATFSASGVISSVSDETWKVKDGVPVDTDAMLNKLEPGYWYYNEEKAPIFGQDRQLGFYAQNVHEAIGKEAAPIPETYIGKDTNGNEILISKPWGYYDRSVLAVTVMSLQNALNNIKELSKQVKDLQNQLKAANIN